MAKNVNVNFGGLLVPGLTILFVALKLLGHITWSWWWVLAPAWIGVALFIVILVVAVFCLAIARVMGGA